MPFRNFFLASHATTMAAQPVDQGTPQQHTVVLFHFRLLARSVQTPTRSLCHYYCRCPWSAVPTTVLSDWIRCGRLSARISTTPVPGRSKQPARTYYHTCFTAWRDALQAWHTLMRCATIATLLLLLMALSRKWRYWMSCFRT